MATVNKTVHLTNGVSYGAIIKDATQNDVYTLTFEGVGKVDYPMAVIATNGTVVANSDGTYSVTVVANGDVTVIAQRAIKL